MEGTVRTGLRSPLMRSISSPSHIQTERFMSINWVRGFRRIGWLVAFPLAAFIVLVFCECTKEFSASDYRESYVETSALPQGLRRLEYQADPSSSRDTYISKEVPETIANEIAAARSREWQRHLKEARRRHVNIDLSDLEAVPLSTIVIVPKTHINPLKVIGLIVVTLAGTAIVIQGSISLLAWILRGFKA